MTSILTSVTGQHLPVCNVITKNKAVTLRNCLPVTICQREQTENGNREKRVREGWEGGRDTKERKRQKKIYKEKERTVKIIPTTELPGTLPGQSYQ